MELKKSPEANLENKKFLFTVIGFAFAFAFVLMAFEWKVYEITESTLGDREIMEEEEILIPITRQEKPPPPPPPPPPEQIELEIVEDDVETEDIDIDSEMEEDTEVEIRDIEIEEEVVEAAPEIFTIVEEQAEFPGGYQKMMEFIVSNIKYPDIARKEHIEGKVFVNFVIRQDGSITDVRVLKGIGFGCDEEAMRVVKMMPKWKPGRQRNKPVNMYFNLPINFTLK